ncbi:MAG: PASTA domain-containing protein [Bacteroidales bacterium]
MASEKLITNKKFWLQFLWAIIILFILIFGIKTALKIYTKHGKEIVVPLFENIYIEELENNPFAEDFRYEIIDSVYNSLYDGGLILDQNPEAGSKVKKGRKIYFTISSFNPSDVKMPDLVNLSLRQALTVIHTTGLKLGNIEYEHSFDVNAVLKQKYQGLIINKDTEIPIGSSIDLVVGGDSQETFSVLPFVYGKKPSEVRNILVTSGLNIGEEYYLDSNSNDSVRAYKIYPEWSQNKKLELGTFVDVYYCKASSLNFDSLVNAKLNSAKYISQEIDTMLINIENENNLQSNSLDNDNNEKSINFDE